MKRKIIEVIALTIMMCYATSVNATAANWNATEVNDIEYYIQTDKSTYSLGENVEILYRVTNLRDEEWTFSYMPPVQDVLVAADEGGVSDTVWFWSWDGIWPTGPKVFHLEPNGSVELDGVWSQIDLNDSWEVGDDTQVLPGIYEIGGRIGSSAFNDTISNSLVTLEITIIPEPTSLAIFFTGLSILITRRKVRHI
jgi:hypothetical protein